MSTDPCFGAKRTEVKGSRARGGNPVGKEGGVSGCQDQPSLQIQGRKYSKPPPRIPGSRFPLKCQDQEPKTKHPPPPPEPNS